MRKDNIRDYAISAFRYYSAMRRAVEKIAMEKAGKPEKLDLLAVENTIELLGKMKHGKSRVEILDLVYFSEPDKPLRRNDITYRVCKASLQYYFSERQVYYFLRDAREAFAKERGLRRG